MRTVSAQATSAASRVVSGFLLVLLGIGCFVLWIGVPAGGMWVASKLTDSFGWHMPLTLTLVLPGMFATAAGLAWLNRLYLRVTGGETEDMHGIRFRRRGPLEPMLIASLFLAIAGLFFWFFALAENPPRRVI